MITMIERIENRLAGLVQSRSEHEAQMIAHNGVIEEYTNLLAELKEEEQQKKTARKQARKQARKVAKKK